MELVEFELAQGHYALPMDRVVELAPMVRSRDLPGAPATVRGLVNHRGTPVALVSLRRVFGVDAADDGARRAMEDHLVIAQGRTRRYALQVDRVTGLRTVDASALRGGVPSRHVRGVVVIAGELLVVQDLDALLSARRRGSPRGGDGDRRPPRARARRDVSPLPADAVSREGLERELGRRYGTVFAVTRASTLDLAFERAADAVGAPSLAELLARAMRGEPSVLDALVRETSVGETYFFREMEGLARVVDTAMRVCREAPRPITVWSAGCATGEEAYSLVILFLEALRPGGGSGRWWQPT